MLADKEDRATLAALRRGLGKPPGSAGEMHPFVIPRLPKSTGPGWNWEQECCFIVASLFAWHPENLDAGAPWERNFGASAKELGLKPGRLEGVERRFVALLNAESVDVPDHLRTMVGLLKTEAVRVDWEQLLSDLTRWDDPERRVQIRWAKAFWQGSVDEAGAIDDQDAPEPESQPAI